MINAQANVITPNIKQQEAINAINGQVMLLAGPGTGKTFTLINRVKKMLEDGISSNKILKSKSYGLLFSPYLLTYNWHI